MKKYNKRIATRLSLKQRQQIDKLVESGKFENLSEVIRTALKEFLSLNQQRRNGFDPA